ncbi:MAG: hypothetical protein CSA84_07585 [Actinomycetales bacterium]|nr:MAG: hypothetical protein CSA84_07585 [Actinomycetales bacterium]
MTFFPLTAPVAALVRNATGSLPWWQALIVVAEVMVIAIVVMRIGVRLFRTGSVSYGKKLNIRKALSARRGDA